MDNPPSHAAFTGSCHSQSGDTDDAWGDPLVNMKCNKDRRGGGGEISTDAGSQASNPCFGARRSLTAAGLVR